MKTKWCFLTAAAVLFLLLPHKARANGACTAARFHDWNDMGCNQNYTGAGGGQASQPCPCATQKPSHGMPQWWVSEPYENLCLSDTPLSYTMSSGKETDFTFYYRQRAKLPESDEIPSYYSNARIVSGVSTFYNIYPSQPSCGTNASWGNNFTENILFWDQPWETSWGARNVPPSHYYTCYPTYQVFSQNYEALVFRPEGGVNYFYNNLVQSSLRDPVSQMRLAPLSGGILQVTNTPSADANGIYWGDPGIGFVLNYPDGSQDVFSFTPYLQQVSQYTSFGLPAYHDSTGRAFLTQKIDPQGRITRIGYEVQTNILVYLDLYRVRYVVDPDGRTNTFRYSSGLQLTEIDDPYGRKTTLGYDGTRRLNSITDAATNSSSFAYQGTNGWISKLTTPYGDTHFVHYAVPDTSVINGFQQRAIYVTEPTGAQQLYFYQHLNASLSATATAPTVPGQTNFDNGSSGSQHPGLIYRNTFHWGRRQFEALPYYYVQEYLGEALAYPASSDSWFSQALAALSGNDYNKAELKHWLMLGSDDVSITESVSSERDPSPDAAGTIPGLRTWYNYPGKPANEPELLGASSQISCVARILPDSTSQYTTYNYYSTTGFPSPPAGAGLVSDNEASYSRPDGSIGVLTNWFQYAANSIDLASISNSSGQYVNYGYNGSHQITTATNALSHVTTLGWDSSTFNLTSVQLPAGKSISLSYNSPATPPTATSAMLQQISLSPEGRTFTINNYSAGLPSNITDDHGLTVANTWDGLNRLTGTSFPDNTTISNIYNRLDLVADKDRLNNWTYYSFDGLQHLTTVTNANNAVTTYSWCGCGSLTTILDALTNLTTLNYDNQGNLTNVVFPDYSSVTYQFDLAGRITNAFDGVGRHVQLAYNNQGLPISITTANGTLRQTIYDALNRPISVTDANGVTVTNQFDALNELLKRTWPDDISEGYGYSAAGLITYTNRDQKVTRYGRDGAGRLTSVTNANTEVTQFGYDSLNNLTSLIDGLLHQTTWQYNEHGWLTNKVDGLTRNVERFTFNANGWITNRWTPEKGNTGYTFDNVGNLKSITYPQQTINYAYDGLNRLTNMVDAVGTTAFSYTPAGRLQSENGPWANDTLTYTYVQGLRTALTLSQTTSNWSQGYGYDSGWRLLTLTSPAGSFGYSYNFQPASSLVTGIQLPNGANIVNSYDSLARLTGTTLSNHWAHALDSYTYTPDALGLRTNIVRNLGLTSSTVTAGFDNIGQLTSWNAAEAGGTPRQNEQLGFGYDAAHNLHTRNNGNLAQTFITDAANQLNTVTRTGTFTLGGATPAPATSVTVNGLAAQTYGDFTFAATNLSLASGNNIFTNIAQNTYGVTVTNILTVNLPVSVSLNNDNNGNLTNDGVKSLSYDAENQLTNVTVANSLKKDFVYDGLNRLRIKREFKWDAGTSGWVKTNEIRFVWDGNNIVQLRNSNNVPTLTLTRGLDLSGSLQGAGGIGGILAMTEATGANSYFHNDAGGNVTALMDAQENVVARRMYGAFGNTLRLTGSKTGVNPFWFSSQLHDEDTDIYSYLHRPYTPSIPGRWLSNDPLGEAGGINLVTFVGNNPINHIDALGLQVLANPYNAEAFSPGSTFLSGNPGNVSVGQYLGLMGIGIGGAALAATGIGLAADYTLAALGLGGAFAETPEGQAELNEAEQALANAAKTCPVSRWGSPLQPGGYVMNGPVSPLNYVLSGKYQPSWFPNFGQVPNIPAPYSSGITYNVPPASLSFPSGVLGPIKGVLGQRIYNP